MEITMQTFAIQDVGDWLIEIKLYEKGSADFSIYQFVIFVREKWGNRDPKIFVASYNYYKGYIKLKFEEPIFMNENYEDRQIFQAYIDGPADNKNQNY